MMVSADGCPGAQHRPPMGVSADECEYASARSARPHAPARGRPCYRLVTRGISAQDVGFCPEITSSTRGWRRGDRRRSGFTPGD